MTLVDWQIQYLCNDFSWKPNSLKAWIFKQAVFEKKPMISPYNPDQVNAASYDVCVGDNIPRRVSAQFALKSSRGREGYEHLSAGFIDPAWHSSKLTMELFNANPNPIPIYKGLKIGQIIFTRCDAMPVKAYDVRGRYNNDNSVRESKG